MSAEITFEWQQCFEDHVQAEHALVRHRVRLRKRVWLLLLAIGGLLLAVGQWLLGGVLVLGVGLGLVLVWSERRVRKQLGARRQTLSDGPMQWTLDASGLRHHSRRRSGTLPWSSVVDVRCTRHHLLLFVNSLQASAMPLRACADISGLMSRIEQWRTAEATPAPPVQLPPDAPWTFAYALTQEDNVQFAMKVGAAAKFRPTRSLVGGVLLVVLGVVEGYLLSFAELEFAGSLMAVVVALGVLMIVVSIPGVRPAVTRFRLRRAVANDPNLMSTQQMQLAFDERGLTSVAERGSGWMAWGATSALSDMEGYLGIMIAPRLGYLLPDRVFTSLDERARFVTEVQDWMSRAARRAPGDVGVRTAESSRSVDNPFAPPES